MKKRAYGPMLAVLSALNFFLGYEAGGFQLAADNIAREFGVNAIWMGVLIASQYAAVMMGPFVLGAQSDRIGKRRTMLFAIPLFILGCAVCALSRGTLSFILGVLTLGVGFSVTESVTAALLADSNAENADRAITTTQLLFGLGAVLSPLIGNRLMDAGLSWRTGFVVCAIGFAVLTPLFLLLPYRDAPSGSIVPAVKRHTEDHAGSPLTLLKQLGFLLLFLSIFFYVGNETVVAYYAETLFSTELNAPRFGAYAISAFWLVMSGARLVFCLFKTDTRKSLFVFRLLLTLCLFAVALVRAPVPLLIVYILTGAAAGPTWPLLVSLAARENPARSGAAASLMSIGSGMGGALLSLLMGLLVDSFGCRAAFLVCAALNLAFFVLFSLVEHRQTRQAADKTA